MKNLLSILALLISLTALQSPLWRPKPAAHCVTATSGATVIVEYEGELDNATIWQKNTATLSIAGPGKLAIHGHEPGKTNLLIRSKDGESRIYDVVVLPGVTG